MDYTTMLRALSLSRSRSFSAVGDNRLLRNHIIEAQLGRCDFVYTYLISHVHKPHIHNRSKCESHAKKT
jgi:hypothetical protein